jgi:hypothetical protein
VLLLTQETVAFVLSEETLLMYGALHGVITTQPLVLESLIEEYALDKFGEQFALTRNKYVVHICRPLMVTVEPVVFTDCHTLPFVRGEAVYSTV